MSVASAKAIGDQLVADGKCLPGHIDLTKKMGADYHYDDNTMPIFLANVRRRMACGNPPEYFQYNGAGDPLTKSAQSMNVPALTVAIDAKTVGTKPPGWVDPDCTGL
jgi:hypothetical protein